MLSNEVINNTFPDAVGNPSYRLAEFTNIERKEFLRKLGLDSGSSILEIGIDTGSLHEETLIRGINTAPDLDLRTESVFGSSEVPSLNFSFASANTPLLPFGDATFEAVVSSFGVMFSARPDRIAAEITRVCKPSGTIALASWTPDSVVGQMFRIASRYASFKGSWPFLWGRPAWVRMCFGRAVKNVEFARYSVTMRFPFPVQTVVDLWLTYCHPLANHFAQLPPYRQTDLRLDLEWLLAGHNLAAEGGTIVLDAEYLHTKAIAS